MGRRRWRFVTIAAFLLFIKDAKSQDGNDYYYAPIERNFAQVQPPVFPNIRPTTFYEQTDSLRGAPNSPQSYNDGRLRFPSPNYDQNPSPFQLPSGRSQSGTQFYLNQPDFGAPQRQRFRPSLPHNYQIVLTTKKPEVSPIHSLAYQNDPSKPETFLGQITLNNPDVDYFQNSRFKNIPFNGNSLKSNGQSGLITHDEGIDNSDEIVDDHKVTTYNPSKLTKKQNPNLKSTGSRFSHFDQPSSFTFKGNFPNVPSKSNTQRNRSNFPVNTYPRSTTEYKALLDLEPLLEDDISDISILTELMKSNKTSVDVEVIKPNNNVSSMQDNEPDASFVSADKVQKVTEESSVSDKNLSKTVLTTTESYSQKEITDKHDNNSEEVEENVDESEYYEDTEDEKYTTHLPSSVEEVTNIYDEYDVTDETEDSKSHLNTTTKPFDAINIKHNESMLGDDDLKHFDDTSIIYNTELPSNINQSNPNKSSHIILTEEDKSVENPSILGQEVVSVVTTKSVVNGTISIPEVMFSSSTEKLDSEIDFPNPSFSVNRTESEISEKKSLEASISTSRSVSGARFLPFPTLENEDKKQVLNEDNSEEHFTTEYSKFENSKIEVLNDSVVENINDKLDSIQSELSSAVLSGTLTNDGKSIEHITDTSIETTSTARSSLNVFTLKSIPPMAVTEKSSPEPLPVTIKKFSPRTSSSTTPTPKKKLVTVMEDVSAFLPPGFKPKLSFKDRRLTTSTPSSTTIASLTSNEQNIFINNTQGRSSGISSKNKVILLDDKSLLPKEYRPRDHKNINESNHKFDTRKFSLPNNKTFIEATEKKNVQKYDTSKFKSYDSKEVHLDIQNIEESKQNPHPNMSESDNIIKLLPQDYISSSQSTEPHNKHDLRVQQDDIQKFLPPNYKPPAETSSESSKPIISVLGADDISKFLPPGYKTSTLEPPLKEKLDLEGLIKQIDISSFLPEGYHLNTTEKPKIDLAALLPPGYKVNDSTVLHVEKKLIISETDNANVIETTTKTNAESSSISSGFKVVFPSRPGGKVNRKTTPKTSDLTPPTIMPKIKKGWPTRVSTEFTGWPSPSTTPFSIEKLLEAQRNASTSSTVSDWSTESSTRRTTTSSTTTPAPPPSTTPGICIKECEIAATIKLVGGVKWVPELHDPHTEEWKRLAKEVKEELNSVYLKSDLKKWYKSIQIDGFSKGSVLVDFFIELNDVGESVNTLQLKKMFHYALSSTEPENGNEAIQEQQFDPDAMLGDQTEEDRMRKSNEKMSKSLDKSTGKLEMGKFVMDPSYTEFIVIQKREEPKIILDEHEEESFLPQWGIAVIVIALASLLFVVIFGVTVLVNRQKNYKAKQPIPLSEDMLRELDKSHMGGFDDMHPMKERELPYLPSGKRMSTAFIEQLAYQNPGDSWRSEWTPQLQKYMQNQNYGADSGRGSQSYGPVGNAYGYNGSQLYGQTGGGSQVYGYTGGEYPRSHHSRRRSEYDSNF